MRVVVINTGTELLLGDVLNTHLRFIAREIFPLGLRIERQVTVPDGEAIRNAIAESLGSAELIFITGGLGPTTDDITREITADLFGLKLEHDPTILRAIQERAARRGFQLTDRVARQADVPTGATVLPNDHGSAPGLYLRANETRPHLFLLPGPPRELHPMFRDFVLPLLRKIVPPDLGKECRIFRVAGLGESLVEEAVGAQLLELPGIELGYCARPGEMDLRLIGDATVLDQAERIIREKLGAAIFSDDGSALEGAVVKLLTERKATLAVAESCTGGYLAHRITNVPGASAVFLRGWVTYSNEAKAQMLGVDPALIEKHGAVSKQVVQAMAEGARTIANSDFGLATTGIAGPSGGTAEKPVGTVFIALAAKDRPVSVQKRFFPDDRPTFKELTTQAALEMLRRRLLARQED
ncbi:MAG TPA: competence/damage-inducible protein A [Chthoniobacterales bacterium]|jgi:nicotinamide-nucleotide amidase|nr:competence/damage-inducible protein A [Chthoniobacterales bacterium]